MRRSTIRAAALAVGVLAPAILAAQTPVSKDAPFVIGGGVVPAPETKLPLKHAPEPTSSAITAKDLMTRLYIFADDSMMGREAGTLGNVKGTDYIASEVKRLGLKPAGDNGTYFQTLPYKTRTIDPASTLSVGGAPLAFGTDWVATGAGSVSGTNVQAVYGGPLGGTMIGADAAAGKLVVIDARQGNPRTLRNAGRAVPNAAAIAVVVPDQMLTFARRPAQFVDDPNAAVPTGHPVIYLTQSGAMKLFPGLTAAPELGAAGATTSFDVKNKVDPIAYPTRNVVAILEGSDPVLKNTYVAIGAHNDHVGFAQRAVDHDSIRIYNHLVRPGGAEDAGKQATPDQMTEINKQIAAYRTAHPNSARLDSISNGADDDGTGSVSVLELAEKFATSKTRPKRSILFIWHVGEEKGLLGSAYFTDHPTVTRDSIVAELNMDMEGRGDTWDQTGLTKDGQTIHGAPNYLQLIGSRRLSTELGDIVEQVNARGKHGFAFDYSLDANGHPMNIYCRSDHYEYARYGIPIVFFTTGGHSDYHQVTDEPQYIDYPHMERVVRLVDDIAWTVGNLDHRPLVDKQKPDPRGVCQQ